MVIVIDCLHVLVNLISQQTRLVQSKLDFMDLDFMDILDFMDFLLLTDYLLHRKSRFYVFSTKARLDFTYVFSSIFP